MTIPNIFLGTNPNDGTGTNLNDISKLVNRVIDKANSQALSTAELDEDEALTKLAVDYQWSREFRGPDSSLQFEIRYMPQSRTRIIVEGGYYHAGLLIESSEDDVDFAIGIENEGALVVGNQAGIHGKIGGVRPDGKLTFHYPQLTGGWANGAAIVKAVSDTRADASLALVTQGAGALARNEPDDTVTGGSIRGIYANDLQTTRSQTGRVSNGAYSFIGGGIDNYTGFLAFCSNIMGGQFNTLEGIYSWCVGGLTANDNGRYAVGVWGWGQFSGVGRAQSGEGGFKALSTSSTPVRMTSDGSAAGSANVFNLPNNGLYLVTVLLAAHQVSGSAGTVGDSAWKMVTFAVKRGANAAATALVGTVKTINSDSDAAASTWSWSVTADTTNGGINITFTGETNKTIRTAGRLISVEVV